MLRDMFCTDCSLQFNKKIVYDLHLSLVHEEKTTIKQEPNNCELTSQDTSETYKRNHSEDKQSQVLQSTCNDKDGKSQGKSVKLEIKTEFKQEFKQEPFEDTNENFDPPSVNENRYNSTKSSFAVRK